jgi:hypothetical protein
MKEVSTHFLIMIKNVSYTAINIVRPTVITLVILTLSVGSQAQTIKKKHPRWNWQKHQAEVIEYAKKYLVSEIEPNLPQVSFEKWFQKTVGEEAKVEWDINDCGEQTGTSADRGRDFPMCVSANTQKAESYYISVNIQFGSFNRGIIHEKPTVRSITIGKLMEGIWLSNLSDLPDKIDSINESFEYLDPNNGDFQISGDVPTVFGDDFSMWIKTMDFNSRNKYVAVKQIGGVRFGDHEYAMREIILDGEYWSFETVKFQGVSFRFEGKFVKPELDNKNRVIGQNTLKGHLFKFVKNKKTAEADLVFYHNYIYDCR